MNFFWSYPILQQLFEPVNYGYLYNWYAAAQPQSIQYGYLYNWYAVDTATTGTDIANIGWHVPTQSELLTLQAYVGGGGKLKEEGISNWQSPNTGATNSSLFTAKPTGYRNTDGSFASSQYQTTILWYSNPTTVEFPVSSGFYTTYFGLSLFYNHEYSGESSQAGTSFPTKRGNTVRLIKDSTTLSHGETGVYVGNDGRVYRTICIGTQEWLSENLMETKYRDGSSIPEVTDNATWAGLTTGARCSYDNTETNAVINTELANIGWHVPTETELTTLRTYLGGTSAAGGELKETGLTYWGAPNTGATNSSMFNGRGSGRRRGTDGVFEAELENMQIFSSDIILDFQLRGLRLLYISTNSSGWNSAGSASLTRATGSSIRLIKDSTTLTHGQTGTYTGNDGKLYPTICIGTQEWLATNLKETLYRDLSPIPEVTDNTAWAALSTGGRCSYENNESNA